ncbi:MAG: GH3 auxin-responsive promoter family protein [Bacteroidales bacterium]|nr:GH3 auxin-responsive promoter family protein [Bacteroidales bacterium]
MAILTSVISWFTRQRVHQIELFLKYPHDVQRDLLTNLLDTAKNTEYGRLYDFESIRSVEEFQQRVPLSSYDTLKPYIDRLREGEQQLLWSSDIQWFSKSSGTTAGRSKFIPVSPESLEECHYKGGKDMFALYLNNYPDSNLFDGRALAMGGSHHVIDSGKDMFFGDVSAILIQNLPFWAEFLRVPSLDIALMDKWEEKIEKMAHATANKNVTNIAGVPSWTLLLLKRILEITNKKDISDVWPNLEVFFHGGVSFTPYRKQFKALISSSKMNYVETYNASEGFFGIQDTIGGDDMLLMLDYGIFYEFIPLENVHDENPKVLTLEQVELNKNYAIVITTNAGLWRYVIGDTVKFTNLSPYRIKISGRTKTFINAFGEELIEDNAIKALSITCEKTNSEILDFTAAPIYLDEGKHARHQWLIEFAKPPEDLQYFSEVLDNALKSQNSDYEAKRYHDLMLTLPEVIAVPEKTFYKWLKQNGKLGGQHKVPRLSNDRRIVDEILEIIQI